MQRIGRFTVIRELGHGGMGSVYLAKDPELERDVAIKLLHRSSAGKSSARAQFRREAQALARMSHAGIVTIFETGEHEGQQFIAMEYLPGRSLRELLAGPETKPPRERLLAACAEVARAVAAAHGRGILHRDIKPENVVVGDGGVKVVDFGLARRLGVVTLPSSATKTNVDTVAFDQTIRLLEAAELEATTALATIRDANATAATAAPNPTVAGTLYGTPAYMAPEVLQGAPASEASDVYSLGVMIYECLGGRRPYEARTLVELIATVVDGSEPPKPLEDPMWPLVARMLSRDPDDRPGLPEVAEQLAPRVVTATRRSRSHRFVVAGIVGVLAVGGVAGMIASRARDVKAPTGTVAFGSFPITVPTFTSYTHDVGPLLQQIVARDNIPTITLDPGSSIEVAIDAGAKFLVRGRAREVGDHFICTIEIIELGGRSAVAFFARDEIRRLTQVIAQLADRVTTWFDPDAQIFQKDPIRAKPLLARGTELLDRGEWQYSRIYLELAVQLDPDLAAAWHALASARAWTIAARELIDQAIANTIRLEPSSDKRQLWIGAAHFYRDETVKAIEVLAPLETRTDLVLPKIDLWNYLGEAYWHDGQPSRAYPYFEKLLAHTPPFLQVRAHVYDYSLWHGDLAKASRLYGLGRPTEDIDIARGNYRRLAEKGRFPYRLHAQLLLGETPDPALVAQLRGRNALLYRIARDEAPVARDVAQVLKELTATPTSAIWDDLAVFTELVLVAQHRDGIRGVLEIQRARGRQPFRGYDRTEIMAAPILGGPLEVDRDRLNTRERKLAAAADAELAGDRATAVAILQELVSDPAINWDLIERAALVRNLAALGRRDALIAACRIVMKPPLFRWSWVPLARACKKHLAAKKR